MLENFYFDHQPLILSGMYDLELNYGLLNLQLPNREYLRKFDCLSYSRMFDHYNHCMWALYGVELEWHSSENNTITFSKTKIYVDINMDSTNGYIEGIILNIEDSDIFLNFLSLFSNTEVSIKFCKSYRIWNKIEDMSKASGIEIEINAPKTPKERRELVKVVKQHFGNNVYIETEANKDFPLEFTSNVVDLDNLESTHNILEFLLDHGCTYSHLSNIHIHISKDYFGNTFEEKINNLHKILILDYYHGKEDICIVEQAKHFISNTLDLCEKYKLNIENDNFIMELYRQYQDKDASTKEDIYPRIDYFKWLRDIDNYHSIEFKWCSLVNKEYFNKSIQLLREYLSVIKYSKEELLKICKQGEFDKIFSC